MTLLLQFLLAAVAVFALGVWLGVRSNYRWLERNFGRGPLPVDHPVPDYGGWVAPCVGGFGDELEGRAA